MRPIRIQIVAYPQILQYVLYNYYLNQTWIQNYNIYHQLMYKKVQAYPRFFDVKSMLFRSVYLQKNFLYEMLWMIILR